MYMVVGKAIEGGGCLKLSMFERGVAWSCLCQQKPLSIALWEKMEITVDIGSVTDMAEVEVKIEVFFNTINF
jgi:hypothetical protein